MAGACQPYHRLEGASRSTRETWKVCESCANLMIRDRAPDQEVISKKLLPKPKPKKKPRWVDKETWIKQKINRFYREKKKSSRKKKEATRAQKEARRGLNKSKRRLEKKGRRRKKVFELKGGRAVTEAARKKSRAKFLKKK